MVGGADMTEARGFAAFRETTSVIAGQKRVFALNDRQSTPSARAAPKSDGCPDHPRSSRGQASGHDEQWGPIRMQFGSWNSFDLSFLGGRHEKIFSWQCYV